ncbi:hypothetical protein LEP1GSC059_0743 [Leptospira noguchii serovar Panama str. CZ214]|uniref:Uncharacterized protein n=2 Tax=Leptospira noguchii TaxID=28182 RepID=T0GYQ4_9LEPT|nr:hypothetical protein LEP1GSC059_0743 [Leptospira noguchii serovar Panama str. CZ214]
MKSLFKKWIRKIDFHLKCWFKGKFKKHYEFQIISYTFCDYFWDYHKLFWRFFTENGTTIESI